MRILQWTLKLAEYNYDVVYKAGKTNINADALSRNQVDLEEANCNIINHLKPLKPNDPKDAEMISKMLEESDKEDEEDKYFKLYLINDEPLEDLLSNHPPEEGTDSTSLTQKKTEESHELRIMEKATTRNTLRDNRMQTRSQMAKRDAQ